jgi:hypothetical protein
VTANLPAVSPAATASKPVRALEQRAARNPHLTLGAILTVAAIATGHALWIPAVIGMGAAAAVLLWSVKVMRRGARTRVERLAAVPVFLIGLTAFVGVAVAVIVDPHFGATASRTAVTR